MFAKFFFLFTLAVAVLAGCSEESTSPDDSASGVTSGVYLFEDGGNYEYLQIPNSRSSVVIRSDVDADYPMNELIQDDDCFFVPSRVPTRTGPERYIRLKDEGVWWETSAVGAEGKIFLDFDEVDQPKQEETGYMFIIHQFGLKNGKLKVAIESVEHPGYFLTRSGNVLAGNGVTLNQYDSPESAPKLLIHQISIQAQVD